MFTTHLLYEFLLNAYCHTCRVAFLYYQTFVQITERQMTVLLTWAIYFMFQLVLLCHAFYWVYVSAFP